MMTNLALRVASRPTVDFLDGLASGTATAINSLAGLPPAGGRRFFIRAISVLANQNFGPIFSFFASAAGLTADAETDTFLARWEFNAVLGQRIGGTGLWRYYIDGLAIPYYDLDALTSTPAAPVNPRLHVALGNGSATAKSADAAGEITAAFWVSPMQLVQ